MILTKVMCKRNPNTIFYRACKFFNQSIFDNELQSLMMSFTDQLLSDFPNILFETSIILHQLKRKNFRFNHNPFMTKSLRNVIVALSQSDQN